MAANRKKIFASKQLWLAVFLLAAFLAAGIIFIQAISRQQTEQTKRISQRQDLLLQKAIGQNRAKQQAKRSRSIVSFFLTQPFGASLAIFSDWEGHYRFAEKGNRVDFIYLAPALAEKKEPVLFSLFAFSAQEWERQKEKKIFKKAQVLQKKPNLVFAALIPPSSCSEKKFIKMRDDLDKVLPTLRVFKLK